MILIWIMNFFQKIAYFFLGKFPDLSGFQVSIEDSLELIAPALSIFPLDMFSFIVRNGIVWVGIHFSWSIIEWVYKKIPGVS